MRRLELWLIAWLARRWVTSGQQHEEHWVQTKYGGVFVCFRGPWKRRPE